MDSRMNLLIWSQGCSDASFRCEQVHTAYLGKKHFEADNNLCLPDVKNYTRVERIVICVKFRFSRRVNRSATTINHAKS